MSGVKSRIKNATNNIKTVKFLLKESVKCIIGTIAYIFIVTYLEKSLRLDHYTLIGNNDMPTCPIVLHVVFFFARFFPYIYKYSQYTHISTTKQFV